MDWFERLTGFREESYDATRAKLGSKATDSIRSSTARATASAHSNWLRSRRFAIVLSARASRPAG